MFPLRQLQSQINFSRRCLICRDQFHIHFVSLSRDFFFLFFFLILLFSTFPFLTSLDQNNIEHANSPSKMTKLPKNYGLVSLFANLYFHYWGFSTILHINHPETSRKNRENLCFATHWTIILNPQIECNCSWKMGISVMFHMCSKKPERGSTVFIQHGKTCRYNKLVDFTSAEQELSFAWNSNPY